MMTNLVQHRIDRMIRALGDPAERAILQGYLTEVSQGRAEEALHHLAQRVTALPLDEQERLVHLYWNVGRRLPLREGGTGEAIVPFRPRPGDGRSQR